MQADLTHLARLVRLTILDPDAAAHVITSRRYSRDVLWSGLVLVTILTIIAFTISEMITGTDTVPQALGGSPVRDAAILIAITVMMVFALYFTGHAMGGQGTFPHTLALLTWFQAVVLVLLLIETLVGIVSQVAVNALVMFGLVVQIWVLVNFVNVLHGFGNKAKAALMLLIAVFGLGFGLGIIIVLIGVVAKMTGAI